MEDKSINQKENVGYLGVQYMYNKCQKLSFGSVFTIACATV